MCAKNSINGLQENTHTPEKLIKLGTIAHLASHVVIKFIEEMFKGFDKRVGEVLVQNLAVDVSAEEEYKNEVNSLPGTD
ncbi:hypothetical protein ACS0TY_036951 [Phlomoides rotata]